MTIRRAFLCLAATIIVCAPASTAAQAVDGHVSLMVDVFPDVQPRTGSRRAFNELRARVFVEREFAISDRIRLTAAGFVEGLVADRGQTSTTTAGIVRPQELHLEAGWEKADLRIGFGRIVWGRLDEFQPTDVVNPLDVARFFFEGRSEGRMPVGLVRGRLLPSDRLTVEAIYMPLFRRGRLDQLDEDTSPFNVAPLPIRSERPERSLSSAQGGVRTSVTTGRVDWAITAFRGYETIPVYELELRSVLPPGAQLVETFPRFTMVGGDFETVRGEWGLRGEVAVKTRAVEAGMGVDRKTGNYRIAGTMLVMHRLSSEVESDGDDVSLVAAVDRSFARETRNVRIFGVYNPSEQSAFARLIVSLTVRDNVVLETSGGWFTGGGDDALSQLATRDFVYARLKVFF